MKFKFKQGDEVRVISGAHRGSEGKVLRVQRRKMRLLVEGVNLVKHHQKATQDNPEGSIVEREASIHYSNFARKKPS